MQTGVLIIDDEEKLRHLLAKIISLEGFHVVASSISGFRSLRLLNLRPSRGSELSVVT